MYSPEGLENTPFPKKQQNVARIFDLASKMGQIKKNKGNFLYQIINNHLLG